MAKSLGSYALIILLFIAVVFGVLQAGSGIGVPPPVATADSSPFSGILENLNAPLSLLLMQVLLIVVAARLAGALFTRIGQPAVVGEMMVGIALGPSLVGALFPEFSGFVFPKASLGNLSLLSQIGILLFMFVVGMELDTRLLKQKAHSAVLVSHASIVFPFLLGLTSSLWLYKDYSGGNTSFLAFALFMGIAMSITAFPVLARIIQERGLTGSHLGTTAITCAAVDDVTAWGALAFIVALAKAQNLAGSAITVVLTVVFVVLALGMLRPALQKMADRLPDIGKPDKGTTVAVLVAVFACALATEAIGIHALFGAFLAGVAMPKDEPFRDFLRHRLEYFSTLFLLPIFFAFTGLRTQVGLLSTPMDWAVCAFLLFIAVLGKFGGSAVAARITGLSWRDSAAIGALMNTRGLMELIVLNLGLDLGVLSPKVFAMLVIMAVVTTLSTGPVITALGLGNAARRKAPEGSAVVS
jgi:Kef-type K+ transport system membrane component KefB